MQPSTFTLRGQSKQKTLQRRISVVGFDDAEILRWVPELSILFKNFRRSSSSWPFLNFFKASRPNDEAALSFGCLWNSWGCRERQAALQFLMASLHHPSVPVYEASWFAKWVAEEASSNLFNETLKSILRIANGMDQLTSLSIVRRMGRWRSCWKALLSPDS